MPGADDKRSEITRRGFCISHLRAVARSTLTRQRLRAKHGRITYPRLIPQRLVMGLAAGEGPLVKSFVSEQEVFLQRSNLRTRGTRSLSLLHCPGTSKTLNNNFPRRFSFDSQRYKVSPSVSI